jgi:hypothetical protein
MRVRHPRTALSITFLVFSLPTLASAQLANLVPDALDPQACGGAGCWTNHLRVTDVDGDGDLDIVLVNYADFFGGNNSPQPLVVYANDGVGAFTNVSSTAVGNFAGNVRQIAIGDVDGDGALDIYAPSGTGGPHVLFMNDGSGVFTNEASTRLPTGYPRAAAARMGDVDGDGDLDIFVADGYATNGPPYGHVYFNDGTGVFSEAAGTVPDTSAFEDIDDVEFVDVDRDFDLDLIVNPHKGAAAVWINDGTGTFAQGGSMAPPATTNFHYNVAPCDVDGDGDVDLWIDNIGGSFREQLLINDGSGNFTDETTQRVTGNPSTDDNGVVCVDVDDDGDFDAVVLSLGTAERLLENDGVGNFTFVTGAFPPPTDCTLWGEFGDLNGDDRLDLVTGQGECSSSDEVYLGNGSMPVDTTPPTIILVEQVGSVQTGAMPVVRFAVSDSTVTDEGPRLSRAYALVGPGSPALEVDARFMGGDLFRVQLPAADSEITFQVCADDMAGNASCSDTQTYGDDPVDAGVDSGQDATEDVVDPAEAGDAAADTKPVEDATADATADTPPPEDASSESGADASSDAGSDSSTDAGEPSTGSDDDGGCSCGQPGGRTSSTGAFALGLLGLILGLARIRSRQAR